MTKTINRCHTCNKGVGTSYCTGCGICFCTKDFQIHRKALSNEMGGVVTHRNNLREKIDKLSKSHHSHSPILAQIDAWQETMVEQVRLVAEQTRHQVVQLLNSKRVKLNGDFARFSQELANLKETEDFVEADLIRLKHKVQELTYDLKHMAEPVAIELHTELSDRIVWSDLIYAQERSKRMATPPRQQFITGEIFN